jgi:hypothetical protein
VSLLYLKKLAIINKKQQLISNFLKGYKKLTAWLYMSVIPPTQEAEAGGL